MELAKLAEFIGSATVRPSGLVIAGEAGIGKTTVWLTGKERARAAGFRVLSARAGQAESVLAYATVADLLADVELEILDELPDVQRIALHRILLRAGDDRPRDRPVGRGGGVHVRNRDAHPSVPGAAGHRRRPMA